MRVLLVEDNRNLALNVIEYLEKKGYVTDYAADGTTALNIATSQIYDIILLDIMLPGIDGYSLCRKLREKNGIETPVIMLTAKDTERDKLTGFGAGADDYLVKPFSLPELEARVIALERRSKRALLSRQDLVVADLVYHSDTMSFQRGGINLSLMPVPRKILVFLMKNKNRVVTREEIEHEIWHDDPPDSEALRSHIYAIRNAIDKNAAVDLLHTIRGTGYLLGDQEPEL